jgi:hypothetical protein
MSARISLLLALLGAPAVMAQEPLAVGDRVRLTAPSYRLEATIGTVRSVSNDRISFRPQDSTESVEVNFRAISVLDRRVGSKSSVVQGLLYGGGAGLLVGGVLGAATCGSEFGEDNNCSGNTIAASTGVGLLAGLVLGVAVLRTDRWERVVLPSGGMGGASLGVRVPFRF